MLTKDRLALQGILEAVAKIQVNISPLKNGDDFFEHAVVFDATLMNFIVIGEMVDRLSDEFLQQQNQVDWRKIKGFRNIIAHDYFGVDAEEVWQIATTHIAQLQKDIEVLLA